MTMTKQYKFDTHTDYARAQMKLTRRKIRACFTRSFTSDLVTTAIAEYHVSQKTSAVAFGVCHGVRRGEELDLFEDSFPDAKWVGTEIVPELCDGTRIINCDFVDVPDEWLSTVDLMYSNSFDHSRYPAKVAAAWVSCLSDTGRLYVEWTPWHGKLGGYGNHADCFAATVEEYECIFNSVGMVETVLDVEDRAKKDGRRFIHSILVVKK